MYLGFFDSSASSASSAIFFRRNMLCFNAVNNILEIAGSAFVKLCFSVEAFKCNVGNVEKTRFYRTGTDDRNGDVKKLSLLTKGEGIFFKGCFCNAVNSREGKRVKRGKLACGDDNAAAGEKERLENLVDTVNTENVYIKNPDKTRFVHFNK